MAIQIIPKDRQGSGSFNGGQIIENKPIGFPNDGGELKPYSNLFYWAYAEALEDSTIGLHPHQGFEIMSFVLRGSIRHFDTKLNEWRPLQAGDAQIIRAGKGISHAEFMAENAVMFQIWVDPNLGKTLEQPASYNDYPDQAFPVKEADGLRIKTYVGDSAPMTMDAEGVEIRELILQAGEHVLPLEADRQYSIYVLSGTPAFGGEEAKQDAFVIVKGEQELSIASTELTKLFVLSSPEKLDYKTYAQIMQERMTR